ncbi:methionyl-trna formyltransferase [Diplodia corticola]|uniref:methionyl-tRNA formyltransferase n=1 Tax=Diplodia corticola TaxID=236234 RepID=A0A1J9R6A1_9PEZI|nr:methionyl-trna formyltransferase [Diplodia corticola]OJD36128.1 methionyl-trna formyltransferase [Diplodia corticola]
MIVRRCARRSFAAAAPPPKLRLLFCGSDDFSIHALRALHREHVSNPRLIDTLDVVHRPGKRTGRGLKQIRQVPIKAAADELALPAHEIDTFTGWVPPAPFDLVVAVSFGLLVPPRILKQATYGGLNVHPSMLPDLYGPAPIHHALLRGDAKTGVSIQTLHPKHFDQGVVLSQTPSPGIAIPEVATCTPQRLIDHLGPIGGAMLVQVLRERAFIPPLKSAASESTAEPRHASKITKEHSHVDFHTWPADRIVRTLRVVGQLWDTALYSEILPEAGSPKRIVIHAARIDTGAPAEAHPPGTWWADNKRQPVPAIGTVTCDGKVIYIESCTIEGSRKGEGTRLLSQALARTSGPGR